MLWVSCEQGSHAPRSHFYIDTYDRYTQPSRDSKKEKRRKNSNLKREGVEGWQRSKVNKQQTKNSETYLMSVFVYFVHVSVGCILSTMCMYMKERDNIAFLCVPVPARLDISQFSCADLHL